MHNEYWNILIAATHSHFSDYCTYYFVHPTGPRQSPGIYIFDVVVTIFLAIDFYLRVRASPQKIRFTISHWYEFPAMVLLIVFAGLDTLIITSSPVLSFKLITFFRLARLYNLVRFIRGNEIFLLTGMASSNNYFWSGRDICGRVTQQVCKYNNLG